MGFFPTEKERWQKRLYKARERGDVDKMRAAIAAGADVNHNEGDLLYMAAYSGFVEGVALLLDHGANPNAKISSGHSALMEAARDGNTRIAQLLLDKGADINAKQDDGKTALHHAAERGRGSTIRLLLDRGADPLATDNKMNTPADSAEKEYPRVADLIRGKQPEDFRKPPDVPATGWHLTAKDEVSSITEKPAIGYRLTEIFNFGAGTYTRIAHNMKTGSESQSMRFLDEFTNPAAINAARDMLFELGGEADTASGGRLTKPVPAPRPQGGKP